VGLLKTPDLGPALMVSYGHSKFSHFCFDGLLLLTKGRDTGVKGLGFLWQRILERKEEERWRRSLDTCQIRQGSPYVVTQTARLGHVSEGSIHKRKWIF